MKARVFDSYTAWPQLKNHLPSATINHRKIPTVLSQIALDWSVFYVNK